ncbi:MAG: hypothetical protein Q8Q53_07760 [Novosphingobium sp.]|nr:hypothetical protein [Novosphingobium sp.]
MKLRVIRESGLAEAAQRTDLLNVTILKFTLVRCQRQLDRMGASVAAAHLDAAIHALEVSVAETRKSSKSG